jgi:hypothetical protein
MLKALYYNTCLLSSRLHNVTIVGFYYLFNCYMFRSYDHLQADIYLLELTLLATLMMLTNILKTTHALPVE